MQHSCPIQFEAVLHTKTRTEVPYISYKPDEQNTNKIYLLESGSQHTYLSRVWKNTD